MSGSVPGKPEPPGHQHEPAPERAHLFHFLTTLHIPPTRHTIPTSDYMPSNQSRNAALREANATIASQAQRIQVLEGLLEIRRDIDEMKLNETEAKLSELQATEKAIMEKVAKFEQQAAKIEGLEAEFKERSEKLEAKINKEAENLKQESSDLIKQELDRMRQQAAKATSRVLVMQRSLLDFLKEVEDDVQSEKVTAKDLFVRLEIMMSVSLDEAESMGECGKKAL